MKSFKYWLSENILQENFGNDHDFSGLIPYHSFKTNDGHEIDVHVFNNPQGKHALFYNKNLKGVTKLVHWSKNPEHLSKSDLEKAGHEEKDNEEHLHEDFLIEKLTANSAGKIAEHSAVMHMIGHMHKQNNTYNSKEHKKDIEPHKKAIHELGKNATPQEVGLRVRHGQEMANAALQSLHTEHGPYMKIVGVGHTAQPGDIGRFSKGKHNDDQTNPSDMAVHFKVPKSKSLKEETDDGYEHHYEGFSLKSSSKQKNITSRNPAIHLYGVLDHPTRKLNTKEISSKGLKNVHKIMGHPNKTDKERKDIVRQHRAKEGVTSGSKIELTSNEHNRKVHENLAKELHNQLKHLTGHTSDAEHHKIGKMLHDHLTPKTSMPYSKIHVQGHSEDNVHATVTPGSDHPLNKVFKNKKTRYSSSRSGNTVTIHKVEKDGSLTPLAHYRPKASDTAFASSSHKWDVKTANTHSRK